MNAPARAAGPGGGATATTMRTPAELRSEASALRAQLDRMERFDWPRWLREADLLTRQITELRRQATAMEQGRP